MSRRFSSSRVPADKLAAKIITQCQAHNRISLLKGQIGTQESLIRQAEIAILKYKKEARLIEEKIDSLPKTMRELNKNGSSNQNSQ
jgi:uncharacterized coiled-coil protein SlyX